MIRRIIKINEELCNGCGACASACHEGAIGMVAGKAKLMREDYCDGLGDCLPACPTNAISFEEREAPAYDEAAVLKAKEEKEQGGMPSAVEEHQPSVLPCGCPGTESRKIQRETEEEKRAEETICTMQHTVQSQLSQWPVQIKLVPVRAPYFDAANLLVAADCTAYAYGNFHNEFIRNRVTLIGCPKLDAVDYAEKLTDIIAENDIQSITVVRMEVPCCGGIEQAVKRAMQFSGKLLPWRVITISTDGRIVKEV